jgi:hypothetical protein
VRYWVVLSKTFVGFGLLAVTPRRKKIDVSCIMQAKRARQVVEISANGTERRSNTLVVEAETYYLHYYSPVLSLTTQTSNFA